MTTVGVVGLGAMGGRIAARLLARGHRVYGTNRTQGREGWLLARGMRWVLTPADVAQSADVVISMVSDDRALNAISGGEHGILAGLRPGQVYIDMSTVSPAASAELAENVGALGATMLDAPVSGSVPQAEAGTLAIMVGGDEAAFRRVEPLLRDLGRTVTHVGRNGEGLVLKLAINISLAVQTLAFSEGLLLAERGGIDPQLAADVMAGSPIGSPMLQARIPLLLDLPRRAWFDVDLMRKDIGLALQTGRELDIPMPSAQTAEHMLEVARDDGYAARDIAALYEVLAHIADGETLSASAAAA